MQSVSVCSDIMFQISAQFRKSRSKHRPDQPGVVFLRIFEVFTNTVGEKQRIERKITTDVVGMTAGVIEERRGELLASIRMLCNVIENRHNKGIAYSVDDVVSDYRKAIEGDESMKSVVLDSKESRPYRGDLITVGREFKSDFKFVYPDAEESDCDNVFDFINRMSKNLKSQGRVSMSRSYISLQHSLLDFCTDSSLSFEKVNKELIHSYSQWLKACGLADSTQSFYLRTFRSLLNHAKDCGLIGDNEEWFKGLNTKVNFAVNTYDRVSLDSSLLRTMAETDFSSNTDIDLARDMFMFGFYCRGMELVDIVNLTKSNLSGDMLVYRRRSKGLEKAIPIDSRAMQIIRKYESMSDTYIFPVKEMYKGVQFHTLRDRVYTYMKIIGMVIKFPRLTFNMNVSSWNALMSRVNLSGILLSEG